MLIATLKERLVIPEENYEIDETAIVLLREEGVYAIVKSWGAHASRLSYCYEGIEFDELRENEDFVVIDNIIFKYSLDGEE
jgi:hypothetical protein